MKPYPILPKPNLQTTAAESYNRIRNHAIHLYEALVDKFRLCQCDPHNANLPVQKLDFGAAGQRLIVVFPNPANSNSPTWTWREIEFELIESQGGTDSNDNSVRVSREVRVGENSDTDTPPKGGPKLLQRIFLGGDTRRGGGAPASRSEKYLTSSLCFNHAS